MIVVSSNGHFLHMRNKKAARKPRVRAQRHNLDKYAIFFKGLVKILSINTRNQTIMINFALLVPSQIFLQRICLQIKRLTNSHFVIFAERLLTRIE